MASKALERLRDRPFRQMASPTPKGRCKKSHQLLQLNKIEMVFRLDRFSMIFLVAQLAIFPVMKSISRLDGFS